MRRSLLALWGAFVMPAAISLHAPTPSAAAVPPPADTATAVLALDAEAIRTALSKKREPLLLSPKYDNDAVYEMVLERFPLGTPRTTILKEFATHFAVFDYRYSPHNGVWSGHDGVIQRRGTNGLTLTVFRDWPLGMDLPLVAYRYVILNFDGDGDPVGTGGRLLDVKVVSEIDAP